MKKEIGKVRPSQFITTFGPGSIVDLPDFSVIMGGINKWDQNSFIRYSSEIEEPRLSQKLNIKKIISIPIAEEQTGFGTLPAYKFPEFHVCPNCRRLGTHKEFIEENDVLYCQNRHKEGYDPCEKIKTHPVRFITACKNGHIDDFPWGFFLHNKHKNAQFDTRKCRLYLEDTGESGSLKDLVIKCTTCNIERPISEAFSNDKLIGKCKGRRPWLGLKNKEKNGCDQDQRILLRGASNLYFPLVESSIVIPSTSNPLEVLVQDEIDFNNDSLINNYDNFKMFVEFNKNLNQYSAEELWSVTKHLINNINDSEDLLFPEWNAITAGRNSIDSEDFELDEQEVPQKYIHQLSKLIRVKRLKEVMVLKGFTRIHPVPDPTSRLSDDHEIEDESIDMKISPLSDSKSDWLPGVESFGEGIFLSLNSESLINWEKKNRDLELDLKSAHQNLFRERKVPNDFIPAFPGIRYVLLHTLSHVLMRELCLHSGYSSSALKERIYSDSKKGMAGILIYTATVDSEGSLGGLVELGRTLHFESILSRALSAAKYCSGDPLCSEQAISNSLQDVNGAACHSCLMMAETSCEKSNHYLDRSILVPTVTSLGREFFIDE